MMDIRTKLKKTDVVAEFLKEEKQSNKDKGDDDLDFEYECPIEKEKQRRREEVQKEFKALAKELKPKKTKEKKEDQDTESERLSILVFFLLFRLFGLQFLCESFELLLNFFPTSLLFLLNRTLVLKVQVIVALVLVRLFLLLQELCHNVCLLQLSSYVHH